jgi:hypothetical protein
MATRGAQLGAGPVVDLVAAFLPVAVVAAALIAGHTPFAVAVVLVGLAGLVDLSDLLARASRRPILPAALVPALGLPLVVLRGPDVGWEQFSGFVAGGFLVAFVALLLFGRRREVTATLGATMVAGLVAGLGGASLLLLHALPEGFRWVLGLLALVVAADVAGPLAVLVRQRLIDVPGRFDSEPDVDMEPGVAEAVVFPSLAAAAAGALLVWLVSPPWDPRLAGLVALAAVLATMGGRFLGTMLVVEAVRPRPRGRTPGILLGSVDGLLLAAPVAYVLARAAAL